MPDDAGYARYGDAVWTRLRALGVRAPEASTVAFFRDPERAWAQEESVDLSALLVAATRFALSRAVVDPDPQASEVFRANAKQVPILRSGPSSHALVLHGMDGLSPEETAGLLGVSSTAVNLAFGGVSDALDELSTEELNPALADHPSTLLLHAFALEEVDELQAGQIEDHLAACGPCFARFEAWTRERERFEALPPPPRERVDVLGPLMVGCLGLSGVVALMISVVAGALFWKSSQPVDWGGQPATITLSLGEDPLVEPIPMGAPISVRFDAHGARYYALLRRSDSQVDGLLVNTTEEVGLTRAPLEVLVTSASEQSVLVALSDKPFILGELGPPFPDHVVVAERFYEVTGQ